MYDGIQMIKYILSRRLSYNIIRKKMILRTEPSNLTAEQVKIDIFWFDRLHSTQIF